MKPCRHYNVSGDLVENAPLGVESWFRCGGRADLLFKPYDKDDLIHFMKQYPIREPLTILGGMANCIIRDGGVRGCVIRLGKPFAQVTTADNLYIQAGAGALNGSVAASAMKAGIGGLEFMSGIPGTVGGALRMNAGAYGREMKDVLVGLYTVDRAGQKHRLTLNDLKMSYRNTELPDRNMIMIGAIFKGQKEDRITVKSRMNDIKAKRNNTQPIQEKTGGSTFANPSAESLRRAGLCEDMRAWQVVEKVGARGLTIGGAQMSNQHCNFMINTGTATASDLENLGDEIKRRALNDLGLSLEWEIKRIGDRL